MEENSKTLLVGYAKVDITPKDSVPLAGYGYSLSRMSKRVLDPLYAIGIALSCGEETILLIVQDLISSRYAWCVDAREQIVARTGLKEENVIICATHTHSGPDTASRHESILAYKKQCFDALEELAVQTLADRSPATLSGTTVMTESVAFVRHYLLNDNTYAGDNFGNWKSGIKDHACPADHRMLLVKFAREGKRDILLMNFQAHPAMTGGSEVYDISADFVGVVRDEVEKQTGMLPVYFTGTAGNQNPTSRVKSEIVYPDYIAVGQRLCKYAVDALPELKPIRCTQIGQERVLWQRALHREEMERLEEAKDVVEYWHREGPFPGYYYAREKGFQSAYHANAIVGRQNRPESAPQEIHAGHIGGLGFVTIPNEVFSTTGIHIREHSPYDMTMILSCANGTEGYLPTRDAFVYGCYESQTAFYARGTAELVQDKLEEMLASSVKS